MVPFFRSPPSAMRRNTLNLRNLANWSLGILILLVAPLSVFSQSGFINGDFEISSFSGQFNTVFLGSTNVPGWSVIPGVSGLTGLGVEYSTGSPDPIKGTGAHIELGFFYQKAGIAQTFTTLPN